MMLGLHYALRRHFPLRDAPDAGLRSIIVVEVKRIASSCGYSVPLMKFEGWRPNRDLWIAKRLKEGPGGVHNYIKEQNKEASMVSPLSIQVASEASASVVGASVRSVVQTQASLALQG